MIGVAVVFGLLAVFVAQSWLNNQAEARIKSLEAQKQADRDADDRGGEQPLRFGNELSACDAAEMPWPARRSRRAPSPDPRSARAGKRVVLTAIEANEPVLASRSPARASAPRSPPCSARA